MNGSIENKIITITSHSLPLIAIYLYNCTNTRKLFITKHSTSRWLNNHFQSFIYKLFNMLWGQWNSSLPFIFGFTKNANCSVSSKHASTIRIQYSSEKCEHYLNTIGEVKSMRKNRMDARMKSKKQKKQKQKKLNCFLRFFPTKAKKKFFFVTQVIKMAEI